MSETPSSNPNAESDPASTDPPSSQAETGSYRGLSVSDLNLPPSAERYEADPDIIIMPLEDIFLLPSFLPPRRDVPPAPPRPPRPRPQAPRRPMGRTFYSSRPASRPSALDQLQELDTTSQVALTLLLACMRKQDRTPEAAPK